MHRAPFAERIDYYRYISARQHFEHALAALRKIRDLGLRDERPEDLHILWTAFFGLYMKPFKEQKDKVLGVGLRLPAGILSAELLDRHKAIEKLRDKMFMHTDFAALKSDDGNPLNAAIIAVNNGQARAGIKYVRPTEQELDNYISHVETLTKKASYHVDRIWKRWGRHLALPNGMWRLNTSPEFDDVFVRYPAP